MKWPIIQNKLSKEVELCVDLVLKTVDPQCIYKQFMH